MPRLNSQFHNDSHAVAVLRAHHSFTRFKAAAVEARRAGLGIVLNPLHRVFTLDISSDTLRWVWTLMMSEFELEEWPADRVLFELANEPGNFNNHSVARGRARFVDLLPPLLAQIAHAQPPRVMVLGGEMGYRDDYMGGTDFVNSGPALVRDAAALLALARRHTASNLSPPSTSTGRAILQPRHA